MAVMLVFGNLNQTNPEKNSYLPTPFLLLLVPSIRSLFSMAKTNPLPPVFLSSLLLFLFIPGIYSSTPVTLKSIQIFAFHSFLPFKTTVFFSCNGEGITVLPDVTNIYSLYTFNGEESWQPLTELPEKKCKRCGLYERDMIGFQSVIDEWELCFEDFVNGEYVRSKQNEFNATFMCPTVSAPIVSNSTVANTSKEEPAGKKRSSVAVIVTCTVIATALIIGLVSGFIYWQKRKRDHDHARFLKIFEENDDIEDELGLKSGL